MNKQILLITAVLIFGQAQGQEMSPLDLNDYRLERIDLALPLLIIEGSKGILACGYVDAATCDKTGEACAIVTGVMTHEDMLESPIRVVSAAAASLGVEIGMTGAQALVLMQ